MDTTIPAGTVIPADIEPYFKDVDDQFSVSTYENGYVIEVSGRNQDEDWVRHKFVCHTFADFVMTIEDIVISPKNL